ncbi:hypothetical protein NT6N_21320 [Oceaniferula spumae]|uniref:N-acetyltransferase domain-containing protein n=1 Tax=Oceaniferula spumae TaxID=2979115 RepID=A0AAT9FMA1_9BACT
MPTISAAPAPTKPKSGPVSVRLIDSWEKANETLRPHWDALVMSSSYPNFFQTWDYLDTWIKHSGGEFTPHILVAEQADQVVALAPMAVGPVGSGGKKWMRQLTFLGCGGAGLSEYLDFLIPAGQEAEILPLLLQELKQTAKGSWDVMRLPMMHDQSASLKILDDHTPQSFTAKLEKTEENASPFVSIPSSWDDYMAGRSAQFRRSVRRKWNKLHKNHGVKLIEAGKDMPVAEAIEEIIRLHEARWGDDSQAFSDDRFAEIHRDLAPRLAKSDRLSMLLLEVDGEIVAGRYDFVFNGILWNYQGGWLPEHRNLSLGVIMLAYSLQWAIDRGLKEYDYLAGEHDYKSSWADDERILTSYEMINPSSVRGTVFNRVRGIKRRLVPAS